MFTKLNDLFGFISPLPIWLKHLIAAIFGAIATVISLLSFSGCGTPKTVATVTNVNPNSSVTVTMTVSNSTTSTPSVDTSIPLESYE